MPNVTLQPSGKQFLVDTTESVLDAAIRQGVGLAYSCRSGLCGSCKARLITGTLHYPGTPPQALSAAEQQAGYVLLCRAHADSDLHLEAREVPTVAGLTPSFYPARVQRLTLLSPDVMQLMLQLPDSRHFRYQAGQYVEFVLANGQRRAFSLANAPNGTSLIELHIRRVPGGSFTSYVFTELQAKAILRVYGPLGAFFLRASEKPAILVGGGTGFAPIKGMLEQAFTQGLTRRLHLYWGVRAQRDLYLDLPQRWAEQHPNFSYTPVLSEPTLTEAWVGRTGWVHEAVAADYPDLSQHEVYMSGPPPMVQAGRQAFSAHGLPDTALYYDSFEFSPRL
jgi:CDP-4-dehydro-6-deoxyglucose reductase